MPAYRVRNIRTNRQGYTLNRNEGLLLQSMASNCRRRQINRTQVMAFYKLASIRFSIFRIVAFFHIFVSI